MLFPYPLLRRTVSKRTPPHDIFMCLCRSDGLTDVDGRISSTNSWEAIKQLLHIGPKSPYPYRTYPYPSPATNPFPLAANVRQLIQQPRRRTPLCFIPCLQVAHGC